MRPVPSKRHNLAVLVLLAVVAANTVQTFHTSRITGEQANMLAEGLKRGDPALYPHDDVFGPTGADAPWRLHLPAWRAVVAAAWKITGRDDPLDALRVVGAAALTLYLMGMYLLLFGYTRSTSVSVLVAVLSGAIFSLRRPFWGIGPIYAVTAGTLYLSLVPLLAWCFLRWRGRWTVTAVFAAAGLAGNIDLGSAANLVAVMFVAMLGLGRLRAKALARSSAALAAAAVAAAPALLHYHAALRAGGAAWPLMPIAAVRDALQLAGKDVLYPGILIEALRWLPVAAMLAIPALVILTRGGRYRAGDLGGWLWFGGAALLVAFVLHGAMQFTGHLLGIRPPVITFFQALRLTMLPLYVLFAQSMVHLFRLARTHRPWVRAALALYAAAFLASSYNTRPLRYWVRDAVSALAGREVQPPDADDEELRMLALWVRDNPAVAPDALFVTPRSEVRLYARRSLLCCPADVPYLYTLAPEKLGNWTPLPTAGRSAGRQWAGTVRDQQLLLEPPHRSAADPDRIVAFVDACWRRRGLAGEKVPAAYVVIAAGAAPATGTQRFRPVRPPDGAEWGHCWKLYEVPPVGPPAGTGPATTASAPAG